MGSQCCSAPQKQQTIELIIDVKGSFHSQTKKNLNNCNEEIKDQNEDFKVMGNSPVIILGVEDKCVQQSKAYMQQDESKNYR